MDSFDDGGWDLLDYSFINTTTTADVSFLNQSASVENDVSATNVVSQNDESGQKECYRKRGRCDPSCSSGTKACREKMRRERLNDRFAELSSVLEPGRTAKIDKSAIIGDAIKALDQFRAEAQQLKDANENLVEEIRNLKAEKNHLRSERSTLKAEKESLEQQLKATTVPPGFLPTQYHPAANKMAVFPGYGLVPMWQYLPPSAVDTSKDHELRPPAA